MAVVLSDTAKAAVLDALGSALDGGNMVFQTAGNATVATVAFNADAFAAASGSGEVSIEADVDPALEDTNCAGNASNNVTKCLLQTAAGVTLLTVGVATSAAEFVLTHVRIYAGDLLRVSSAELYMSA